MAVGTPTSQTQTQNLLTRFLSLLVTEKPEMFLFRQLIVYVSFI